MNTHEAETLVRKCLHEVAPEVDLASVAPDDNLREALQLDSLDFLRLVELLSEGSGRRIDEDEYPQLASLTSTMAFLSEPMR